MGMSKDIRGHMRKVQNRVVNSIARAVVQVINDGKKMQELQLGVLEGEEIDDAERFQSYGFGSVPEAGAEAVVLFPGGDRAHPLVVVVDDRRYRPTGKASGETYQYCKHGQLLIMKANGDIEVSAKSGQKVKIADAAGGAGALPLATKADVVALTAAFNALVTAHNAHTHSGVTAGAADSGPTSATGAPAPVPVGTIVLDAK